MIFQSASMVFDNGGSSAYLADYLHVFAVPRLLGELVFGLAQKMGAFG